jgi:very-short-patch-repair endonuclease
MGPVVLEMDGERGPQGRGGLHPPRPGKDWMIAELATRQYGVVSRKQLLAAGIGPGAVETRVRRHQLHRLHRGVYAVGHTALVPLAREMAAVLACGPDSAISHRAAAVVLRLLERPGALIDVTVRRSNRSRPGLRIHRSRALLPADVCWHEGIPVTTPNRTLVDLAETEPARDLERAFDEAITQRLTTYPSVSAAVERSRGRQGVSKIRELLARSMEPTLTRSEAEERCLALIREAALPAPEVNGVIAGHRVDFSWREEALILEVDGYRFHSSRSAFERDRRRDAELQAAGFRVMRVTWRQLTGEPIAVATRLARALAGWPA